jgi:hypothetical protein
LPVEHGKHQRRTHQRKSSATRTTDKTESNCYSANERVAGSRKQETVAMKGCYREIYLPPERCFFKKWFTQNILSYILPTAILSQKAMNFLFGARNRSRGQQKSLLAVSTLTLGAGNFSDTEVKLLTQ